MTKGTGNHLIEIKSISLEEFRALSLISVQLRIECSVQKLVAMFEIMPFEVYHCVDMYPTLAGFKKL